MLYLGHIIFNPRTFTSNLTHNLEYFFIGRHTGLLGYFFPAVFAMGAFLLAPRQRPAWQWLVLASGLLQGLMFIIRTPYTWHGGGVGNRYFFSGYGVMLFVLPPIQSAGASFAQWAIGSLFVAPMVLNPFVASFHPEDNAKSGPLRLLPVELTLVNDLPVNNEPDHSHSWFGDIGPGRSRIPCLLSRRQRLRSRTRQELLDSRPRARRVHHQDRQTDPAGDFHADGRPGGDRCRASPSAAAARMCIWSPARRATSPSDAARAPV